MLYPKSDFIGLEGVHHLAAGGETPMLHSHLNAMAQFAHDKALGMPGRERFFEVRRRVATLLADMMFVSPGDIAFVGNSSAGINQVTHALNCQHGDEVVVVDDEYPSGRYAFVWLRRFGVRVIMPKYLPNPDDELTSIIASLTPRTRLVYVSHVSTRTGRRIDINALAHAVHAVGAELIVDATHSLGIIPVDASNIDYLVCSGYKWLLGTHLGILMWNRNLVAQLNSPVGWRSAKPVAAPDEYELHADAARAEVGNPNFIDLYILENALRYANSISIEAREAHALQLGAQLYAMFEEHGHRPITPIESHHRAGNICVATEHAAYIVQAAQAENLIIWGDHDLRRIRCSVHGYVDAQDVAVACRLLPQLLR
ncbi:MAG: aminotransferase class V-fold PLP-dependent enzyme [Chloroflexi bacterium]|nr:aminotransferase class V-fold PLP-dependent enzyme [Chloroflexota bacterium]